MIFLFIFLIFRGVTNPPEMEIDLTQETSKECRDDNDARRSTVVHEAITSSNLQARFKKTVYSKYFESISDQPPTVRCIFDAGGHEFKKCTAELKLQKGTYSNIKRHLEV